MKKLYSLSLVIILLSVLGISGLLAQEEEASGSIRGGVFVDVNGDGKCAGTGIAGEIGIASVSLEFVNSDGGIVLSEHTGTDGTFGLVGMGQSYWRVTVKPSAGWKITSAATLYALIDNNNREAENVNFCLSQTSGTARTVLPQAGGGAANAGVTAVAAVAGLLLVGVGMGLELKRRLG